MLKLSGTNLGIIAFAAAIGLQEFYPKVAGPARMEIALEQKDLFSPASAGSADSYNTLFQKLTENYSADEKQAMEDKVNDFTVRVYRKGIKYACQFCYLMPENEKELFLSLFAEESFGRPDAVSPTGNVGLGQLSEIVAEKHNLRIIKRGKKILYDERCIPDLNAEASIAYYDELYSRFERHDLALLAYNHGPTKVRRALADLIKNNEKAVTAGDILFSRLGKSFTHRNGSNYLAKKLGYAMVADLDDYSVQQFNELFKMKQIKDEKSLIEIARKNKIPIKEFLRYNKQFRDENYCKPGLFYIVPV